MIIYSSKIGKACANAYGYLRMHMRNCAEIEW